MLFSYKKKHFYLNSLECSQGQIKTHPLSNIFYKPTPHLQPTPIKTQLTFLICQYYLTHFSWDCLSDSWSFFIFPYTLFLYMLAEIIFLLKELYKIPVYQSFSKF